MASVRARRGNRKSRRYEEPAAMPRLIVMKREARYISESLGEMRQPRNLMLGMAAAILMTGVAVAGAAWIGGSLFDAREAFASTADRVAASAGFEVKTISVGGVSGARAEEVRAAAMPAGRESLFSASPEVVRERVQQLDWVESVKVRRLWPGTVRVEVARREAYALWKAKGAVQVIDAAGAVVPGATAKDYRTLPLVSGKGADHSARPILATLENLPNVRARVTSLVRVGERRWNLKLKSGAVIALPEEDAPAALVAISDLQAKYKLLDRNAVRFDMRTRGQLAVLPRDTLAGGPGTKDDDALLTGGA